MLVTSLYNIVDQIFIGQGVGLLGNAATNIAFPLSIACTAIALLLGIGSATNFSLQLGAGNEKRSAEYAGNGLCLMALFGTVLMAVTLLFLTPMLKFFGATPDVLPYAEAYTRITALGFPFLIMNTGMSKLILADGSPRYSMMSMLIGALINTALDPLFIFGLDMGMTGAALATILGQIASFCISIRYLFHFKSVPFSRGCFTIDGDRTRKIFSYGASACFNQIAMAVVQIVLNNTLAHYGALSIYGSDIPLACAGIISKVNMIFMSFVIGISQGVQPIIGFNYGAALYRRVKRAICWRWLWLPGFLWQRLPASSFSRGRSSVFSALAARCTTSFRSGTSRIYMFLTLINGIQPVTSNFFNSIGKARLGVFMSLTRQILFLLPLIVIFPLFMGIDGVMYAGPIADGAAAIVCGLFTVRELRELTRLQQKRKNELRHLQSAPASLCGGVSVPLRLLRMGDMTKKSVPDWQKGRKCRKPLESHRFPHYNGNRKAKSGFRRRQVMDEHDELRTRLRAVGMELFRRDGLRFTMQQAAAMMHISKKTIYAVYPSKGRCCWIWWTMRSQGSTPASSASFDGPGTLAEKLRAVIIALPEEYTALDLQQMDLLDEKISQSRSACA